MAAPASSSRSAPNMVPPDRRPLRLLTWEQLLRIDELLAMLHDDGEIHLIVRRRKVRQINKVERLEVRR